MLTLTPLVRFKDADILNLPIPIYLDDTLSIMLEKLTLFQSEEKFMFPPYLRIEIFYNNKLADLELGETIVSYLDKINAPFIEGLVPEIIVTNLIDELRTSEAESFYLQMTNGNGDLFNKLKKNYLLLREDYLQLALKIILYGSNPIVYSSFEADIETATEDILSEITRITTSITKVYDKLGDYIELSKKAHYTRPIPQDFIVTNAIWTVDFGKHLDIVKIFNTFVLSESIPFIGIGGQYIGKKNPVVRLFRVDGQRIVQDKELRDFYVTENRKRGAVTYKTVRGLMFKMKIPESTIFASILVEPNGNIWINMKPNKKINEVTQILEFGIRDLVNRLKGGTNHIHFNLVTLSVNLETESYIDMDELSVTTKRPSISRTIIELKDIVSQDLLSLLYKNTVTVNVRDNPYKTNSSIVSVLGIKGIWQIIAIYLQVLILDGLYTSQIPSTVKQQVKERSNIKRLKELGVKVKSTNCQKQRQPIIVDPFGEMPGETGAYPLEYNGNTYVCTTKEYPFPGFTNENILCCFKKDQRNKEAFLRNTGRSEGVEGDQQKEDVKLKKHIITTEKLLESDRLGVLPQILKTTIEKVIGIRNLFRLGVLQDRWSFLNSVASANGYKTTTEFWIDFRKFLDENRDLLSLYIESSIINADVHTDISQSILDNPVNLLLAISYFTSTNYLIFNTDRLECNTQIVTDNYNEFIVLLRKEQNWEILVEKIEEDGLTTRRRFSSNHPMISFLREYYNATCKKLDNYPPNYPYKPLPYLKDILSKVVIQSQIVDENNMVSFILTEGGGLIPVRNERIKLGIPYKWLNEVTFPDIDTEIMELKKVGQNAIGIIKSGTSVIGVISNVGVTCPIQPFDEKDYTGPLKEERSILGPYILSDGKIKWTRETPPNEIEDLRRSFAEYLSEVDEDLRRTIYITVTDIQTTHEEKFKRLEEIIPTRFRKESIIRELIVENKFSDILNDTVPSKFIEIKPSYNEEILYDW